MKTVFDYSEYVTRHAHRDRDLLLVGDEPVSDVDIFFGREDTVCPFCNIDIKQVHHYQSIETPVWLGGGLFQVDEFAWSCSDCGWWRVQTNKDTTGDIDAYSTVIKNAVLKKYDLSGKEIPIGLLQQHLNKKFDDIIHINDEKMENLVQSVFSEHFACEAEHIGRSNDGGIDLILIDSNMPTVVQVRRRKTLGHTESVSCIREFLGATLLSESKNCIYVSTCNRFSPQAVKAARAAVDRGIVESYELYNFQRFQDVLKLTKVANSEANWKKYLNLE